MAPRTTTMRTDERPEEDSGTTEHPGLMERLGHAVTEREVHLLDRTIGLFQRWRNRLEPPAEEDDRRGGRRGAQAEAAPAAAPPAPARGRLRGFLIVVALLLAAGFAGMSFSYALLRKTLESDGVIIDDLRDQLSQMEKDDARKLSIQARDQNQLAEQRKTIREHEAKLQEYEDQLAQLRQQVAALTAPPPRPDAAATAGSRQARAALRAAPQKTGNCVATGSTAAADLARCVENFNRP